MLAQLHTLTSQPSDHRNVGGEFTPERRVWLSRGVVALCHWRLEHILHNCDPSDLPLAQFLKERIAAEEESADSLKRMDWTLHRNDDVELSAKECDRLLLPFMPSAFSRTGEGHMDRDAALHFVEILESERKSFFIHILQGLSDDLLRVRLKAESDRSEDRLDLVRTVLLPPPRSRETLSMGPPADGMGVKASDRRGWVVLVSGLVNRLNDLQRASRCVPLGPTLRISHLEVWRPLVADLLQGLTAAAGDAVKSDEPLAKRFIQEFTDLRMDDTRAFNDILGVARVALAWLVSGHTLRNRLNHTGAKTIDL